MPIVVLGDFNSWVDWKSDYEYEPELEGLYLEQEPLLFFVKKHGLLDRMRKDGHINNNGNMLI